MENKLYKIGIATVIIIIFAFLIANLIQLMIPVSKEQLRERSYYRCVDMSIINQSDIERCDKIK